MLYYPNDLIDRLLGDDAPLGDLTTRSLGLEGQGRMTFMPRRDGRLSGLTVAKAIIQRLNLEYSSSFADGDDIGSGTAVLEASGDAAALHMAWKVCQNIMEWASGVATHTASMLAAGREQNPGLHLACTRKSIPGTKPLAQAAVLHGGGIMHRAGLSETILIFAQHRCFCDKPGDFAKHIAKVRRAAPEKKIVLEVDNMLEVRDVFEGGVLPDILQLDKFPVNETATVVKLARESAAPVQVSSAGGVNLENIAAYAATGIDLVVSSAPYYAKPLDIKVIMEKGLQP